MSLQLFTPALNNAFDNLINGIKDLTDTLSSDSGAPYLTPPQTPGKSHRNASRNVVTSPYFTRNVMRKRDRSLSPPSRKKKSRKVADISTSAPVLRAIDAVKIPVTSPYFPLTPENEKVLKTPVRGRKGSNKHILASPYFVASTEGTSDIGPSQPKRRRKRTAAVIEEPIIPTIEPPERWWETEALPVRDTISFTHFQTHSFLYYQLWLAKPVLIQGTYLSIITLLALILLTSLPRTRF